MMVGYVHGSTTTWRVWDPEHQTVRTQSDVIFNEARNVYVLLPGDPEATTNSLGLVKELVHVEVLEVQPEEVGRTAAVREVGRTDTALREVGRTATAQEIGSVVNSRCHTQSGQEMDQIRLCDIGWRNIGPTVRSVDRVLKKLFRSQRKGRLSCISTL